ncbi:aldehyde dehydrogenase family protein [Methanofollis formosanus]|uniref:Aldehyde dehydrogenase family protein n=1 Tax=Methanofollis formosanus TaxID=299308 RepID=A0A8G1EGJ7_9EURY|nr:aldehyde dehydrogenase family protein [Methanofollis formosanus]QYZ78992.1 aldehyde dehydrogenase family protein [Methanofollis formosanus]
MKEPRPFLVGGERRRSEKILDVRFPYDDSLVGTVCLAGPTDLEDAVRAAQHGFGRTRRLPTHERIRVLKRFAALIDDRKEEIAGTITQEAGKTAALARAEVERAVETVLLSAEEAGRIYGEVIPLDLTPATGGRTGYLRRVPLGTVLAITPFNFPFNLACHKIGPAVAAGNAVILKPSSKTPLSGLVLGDLLVEAGYPEEAVSVLPCTPDLAEWLVRDGRIAYLSFTGSPAVGWHLREIAGRKRVGLELGGNAAVIVDEDADLTYAAERIVQGGFSGAGQVCISVQRVFLHRAVYRECLEMVLERTGALRAGDPRDPAVDVGPMISEEAAAAAEEKVKEAVFDGATVLAGGGRDGTLFAPTILADTLQTMRVNATEMFAPVITVTPFDDFEAALAMVNDSPFGLQAGVFTNRLDRAFHAFDECEVGGLIVNDIPTFRADAMPYGGVKASGMGREGPRYVIEEMTEPRLMVLNRRG